jgi:tetratricopeptide (TPR) repeat protein
MLTFDQGLQRQVIKNMVKKFLLLLALTGYAATVSRAQSADSLLFNKLGDFDLARANNDNGQALRIGEEILPDTAKLSVKTRTSFFGRLAKLYEDDGQDAKAIVYYQKVVRSVPDYYVAHRALGYLYDNDAEEIHLKLYQTKSNDPAYKSLADNYKAEVLKALPHLEKAQACDPDDDTLDLIKTLYENIHDLAGLDSLSGRLSVLGSHCIDILSDN